MPCRLVPHSLRNRSTRNQPHFFHPHTVGPRCITTTTDNRYLRPHLHRFGRPIVAHHDQAYTGLPTPTWCQCIAVQVPTLTHTRTITMQRAPVLMLVGQATILRTTCTCHVEINRMRRGLHLALLLMVATAAPGPIPAQVSGSGGKNPPWSGSSDWNTCASSASDEKRAARQNRQTQESPEGDARERSA